MKIPVLRVKDSEGNFISIPAIRGEKGEPGSAAAVTVNGKEGDAQGNISLTGADIPFGETTVDAAIAAKQDKITASGLLKADGNGSVTGAVAAVDYATPAQVTAKQDKITASGLLKGSGNGSVTSAAAAVDYATPAQVTAKQDKIMAYGLLKSNGNGVVTAAVANVDYPAYETGTWKPSGSGVNSSASSGRYTVIGKIMFLYYQIHFNATPTDSTLYISGLPKQCMTGHYPIGDYFNNMAEGKLNGYVSVESGTKLLFRRMNAAHTHSIANAAGSNVKSGTTWQGMCILELA